MPKIWTFTENDDGSISNIQRSYSAEIKSPLTKRKLIEKVEEKLELSDLHKALNLTGNEAKIAKLEEQLAKKDERIEKLLAQKASRKIKLEAIQKKTEN